MLPSAAQYFRRLSAVEKKAVYERCEISRQYFYNLISQNSKKKPSVDLVKKLQAVTKNRVTRYELRPDLDWDLIDGKS